MGARWHRPRRCGCGKIRYPSEDAARAHAESNAEHYGGPVSTYRCPGSSSWHVATRGFSPNSLHSRARILAWHLCSRGVVDVAEIARREFGDGTPAWRRVRRIIRQMEEAGLVAWNDPRPGCATALDRAALRRICAVGWECWCEERAARTATGAP